MDQGTHRAHRLEHGRLVQHPRARQREAERGVGLQQVGRARAARHHGQQVPAAILEARRDRALAVGNRLQRLRPRRGLAEVRLEPLVGRQRPHQRVAPRDEFLDLPGPQRRAAQHLVRAPARVRPRRARRAAPRAHLGPQAHHHRAARLEVIELAVVEGDARAPVDGAARGGRGGVGHGGRGCRIPAILRTAATRRVASGGIVQSWPPAPTTSRPRASAWSCCAAFRGIARSRPRSCATSWPASASSATCAASSACSPSSASSSTSSATAPASRTAIAGRRTPRRWRCRC